VLILMLATGQIQIHTHPSTGVSSISILGQVGYTLGGPDSGWYQPAAFSYHDLMGG